MLKLSYFQAKNCTQSIELDDFDGTKLLVERGTAIQLPGKLNQMLYLAEFHVKTFYTIYSLRNSS